MHDLQACLTLLEEQGRLTRVATPVNLKHELAGVARHFEGKNVLLFEHVTRSDGGKSTAYDMPVCIGLMWSRENLARIFGVTARELPFAIGAATAAWRARATDADVLPVVTDNAPAQQVRMDTPDLAALPTPVLALGDGGPYLSNCVVIAKDPDTGVRNASIHRFMITGPDRMTMLLDRGRHLRDYYERAERRNQPLEITINNGVHPAVTIAAITPSGAAPIELDELGIASVLQGAPLALCRSHTVAPEGVAHAQYIIEGEMLPHVREPEGPFGEVAGYYGAQDNRWVVRVKAITRRAQPIVHTLLPGAEVYNCVGLTAEAAIFRTVSAQVPGVLNVHMSHCSGFYTAVLQMEPTAPGAAKQAILATFAAFAPLQIVTVVNADVDIFNQDDVQWAVATRFDPAKDLIIVPNACGHELNPQVSPEGLVNKTGFDCTCPVPQPEAMRRVAFADVDMSAYSLR